MPTVVLRFPAGRYHATPWEHHVNEGIIEWPPSPWRLLRAFISTGYTKLHWPSSAPPVVAQSLITKLAAEAPAYALPRAAGTHTRHYMPLARLKSGREETTLVFDTWAQVGQGVLFVRWDVDLEPDELATLQSLVTNMGYLGRSESWVDGDLLPDEAPGVTFDVVPRWGEDEEVAAHPAEQWETVRLRAAQPQDEYTVWRRERVATLSREVAAPQRKRKRGPASSAADGGAADAVYPADLVACLQVDTHWLHQHGWNEPPGSRLVPYWRRRDALEVRQGPGVGRSPSHAAPACVLLALATESGSMSALPPTARVLPQGELLHRALVSQALRLSGHSVVLSGTDKEARPLTTPHTHAHLFHLDLDDDGHLDHVLVWAPMGLDPHAMAAIRAVRRTFTKGGMGSLRVATVGYGELAALTAGDGALQQSLRTLGPIGGARRWTSVTPFVPPRFLKSSGRNSLDGQVAAELLSRGLPQPERVHLASPHESDRARRMRHYVTRRREHAPPMDLAFALDIEFATPVSGPIALGYGSHFGLGLFAAADDH
jgi:CRISPR-associated protein Csb2